VSPPVPDCVSTFAAAKFETADDPKAQLEELIRLEEVVEKGSASLNQRATTLGALAVAALGAFGIFAGKIGELEESHQAKVLVAIALAVASIALFLAAAMALWAARPSRDWVQRFGKAHRPVVRGDLSDRGERVAVAVKGQLLRNKAKAGRMSWAYGAIALALVAVTFAVVVVAVNAPG
jgi:formate hydrogenlyase subunit 3/multisubunit Na+/H+ antiporter MnhD subunit